MNQDSRGYFVLPQAPEEAAYYTYGTPGRGVGQYAHAKMLTFIFHLEHRWGVLMLERSALGILALLKAQHFRRTEATEVVYK